MLADNHALINRRLRVDKHGTAILQIENCIGDGCAGLAGNQRAIAPPFNIATIGRVIMKHAVQHAGAAGLREKAALIADKTARRCVKHHARFSGSGRAHIHHMRLAAVHAVDHGR